MNHMDFLKSLDELVQRRSILKHPFYQAWQHGNLNQDQLRTYAQVYYPHVAAFPHYLQSALNVTHDPAIRTELETNLADELDHPKAHNELWLDFATGLGLDRQAVVTSEPTAAAQEVVRTFTRLAGSSSAEALAALYAYESQQPEVASEKMKGLAQMYGIDSPAAVAYFAVHAEADLEHRAGERRALQHCLETGVSPETIHSAAEQALDAYWLLLDGICEEAGVPH